MEPDAVAADAMALAGRLDARAEGFVALAVEAILVPPYRQRLRLFRSRRLAHALRGALADHVRADALTADAPPRTPRVGTRALLAVDVVVRALLASRRHVSFLR